MNYEVSVNNKLELKLSYKNGQFISNVERALCNIPLKMLTRVCDILNITSAELKDAMLADYRETLDNFLEGKGPALAASNDRSESKENGNTSLTPEPSPQVVVNSTPFRT